MESMEKGKDINDLLNMPYNYVIEVLKEKNKPKRETSLMAAFGG
ncbi:phage tail assembly chaperone GT [Halobacillus litoralis]|nr:hypothetical protein [Halobacillus litoralis]